MDGPNANGYIYQPLTSEPETHSVRLCRLAPAASYEEKIKCELFNTALDAKNDFEALSYTWGEPTDTLPILIHDKPFDVTRNLAMALRSLRHVDRERVMWIDAICINQLNTLEKNQQVRQMKNIYGPGGARQVVVWLGGIPNARKAMDFCARMQFCREKVRSWNNECQKRREERKKYGSKALFEQPYNDDAAKYAAKQLWTHMEVNKHSRDALKYFRNQSKAYRGTAEMEKTRLAEFREHGKFQFEESYLTDTYNATTTAYEATRLLWNRMREPSRIQDNEPVPGQQLFEGDTGDMIRSFSAQYPGADTNNLVKYIQALRVKSKPGKHEWDLIQRNKDARQAARVLWERIEEEKKQKVVTDLQDELLLEHKEENEACQYIFLDAPWWSRVWILQEVIHSGEVVVLLGEGRYYISFEELLEAYDNWKMWKMWKQEHNNESLFARTFASLRTRQQQLESKDADIVALDRAWKRDQDELNLAMRNLSRPVGLTEEETYNITIEVMTQPTDPREQFKDLRSAARVAPLSTGTMYPPTLAALIIKFRDQHATDARDKIYALLGMIAAGCNGADITVDYRISIKRLYVIATRALLKKVLLILLLVESPERAIDVDGDSALPSWVIDHRTTQDYFPKFQFGAQERFSADVGFPPVEQEPRFRQATDAETLILRGLYVGVVTSTLDARFTDKAAFIGRDVVRLITYDRDPVARYKTTNELELAAARDRSRSGLDWDRPDAVKSSSWGPMHAEAGDSIIIVAGLKIPIVVRRVERGSESRLGEKYLFVGGCCLVDSRVNSQVFESTDWRGDSGFSPIMFGSALKGLPSDWKPEEFTLW